jgi:protein-L-isoaspartate(D-aspartate) O-methyltransferase
MRVPAQYTITQPLRDQMVKTLALEGVKNKSVLDVMGALPREIFLDLGFRSDAYKNSALPIGESYQAAILSRLVRRLFSIERHPSLSQVAVKRFESLGIFNVVTKVGDGTLGWAEQAPFDRIMVTAASPKAPKSLLEQLTVGGILVIPVGDPAGDMQMLMRYTRTETGFEEKSLGPVRFVPLIGAQGVPEAR